jgi:hypothetical protein
MLVQFSNTFWRIVLKSSRHLKKVCVWKWLIPRCFTFVGIWSRSTDTARDSHRLSRYVDTEALYIPISQINLIKSYLLIRCVILSHE